MVLPVNHQQHRDQPAAADGRRTLRKGIKRQRRKRKSHLKNRTKNFYDDLLHDIEKKAGLPQVTAAYAAAVAVSFNFVIDVAVTMLLNPGVGAQLAFAQGTVAVATASPHFGSPGVMNSQKR